MTSLSVMTSTPRFSPPTPRRRSLAVASALLAFGPTAALHAQSAPLPFDTASTYSEQVGYSGASPQLVGYASGDTLTVAWQHYDADRPTSVRLTSFKRSGASYARAWEKQLPLARLTGMTSDGTNFYVASAVSENLRQNMSTVSYRPNVLIVTKLDAQGNQVWLRDVNTAAYLGDARSGSTPSAIFSPLAGGSGALAYGNGKIVVALASNTLPDTAINDRHQRAQYFVIGEDGSGFKAASETSWRHSFDQRLLFDGQDFVFMDLADAGWYMPAGGISLRKIKPSAAGATFVGDLQGTYVYVRQSETAGSQNFTFTSLGDLERGARGYVALFTSEKSNNIVTRSGWELPLAEPRNLGLVHVTKAFDTVKEGEWNSTEKRLGNTIIQGNLPIGIHVSRNVVDSAGPSATFRRPDKPEKTFTQTGVVWLTNLPAGVSAERPKLVRIADDRYLALWEEWTYAGSSLTHRATKGLVVNEQGQIVRAEAAIAARLNPSGADRPFLLDGRAAWVVGDRPGGKLTLHTVDANLTLTTTSLSLTGSSSTAPAVKNQLLGGDVLRPGEKIQSANGRYTLTYQTDGNLVVYDGTTAKWASNTNGRPVGRAIMQTDGNLVIYGPNNAFIWNSGTVSPGSKLIMQDDGNLVIYRADGSFLWNTGI